jgi:hypothetical protein
LTRIVFDSGPAVPDFHITEVGASLWTGAGHVGATTGEGNSDLIVGPDNVHPSQAGHDTIGLALATQIARYALPGT